MKSVSAANQAAAEVRWMRADELAPLTTAQPPQRGERLRFSHCQMSEKRPEREQSPPCDRGVRRRKVSATEQLKELLVRLGSGQVLHRPCGECAEHGPQRLSFRREGVGEAGWIFLVVAAGDDAGGFQPF